MSSREDVSRTIREAFAGVTLGSGTSARQTRAIDQCYDKAVTDAEFAAMPASEVTEDWASVPAQELEEVILPHIDAEGFRYYIPALMLRLVESYDSGSMRVMGTLGALYPTQKFWIHQTAKYALLSDAQKQAIAQFLQSVPSFIMLDAEDAKIVHRALRNYWSQYVPQTPSDP